MHRIILIRVGTAVAAFAVLLAACSGQEGPASPVAPSVSSLTETCPTPNGGDQEEELFGVADISVSGDAMLISLKAGADTSRVPINRLPECDAGGGGHDNHGDHFGWYASNWDVSSGDYHCDDPERHREEDGDFLGTEAHCIDSGDYLLQLSDNLSTQRPLDFFNYWAATSVPGDTSGVYLATRIEPIAPPAGQPSIQQPQLPMDIWVAYRTSGSLTVNPGLAFSPKLYPHVLSDHWNSIAPTGGQYYMPQNFDLRVHAAASTGWNSETLVRFAWNCCSDTTATSNDGFTNLESGGTPLVRTHRYSAPGTYAIRAHFAQPWQRPASAFSPTDFSYGTFEAATLVVTAPLTASIAPSGEFVVDSLIQFTAGGGNGGGGLKYFWNFGDSPAIDSTSGGTATHEYSTAGTRTVTLSKRDQHGYVNSAGLQIVITQPAPALPVVTSFGVSGCDTSVYGSKTYNNWDVSWTTNPASSPTVFFDIGISSTNDSATASVIKSGKAHVLQTTLPPFLQQGSSVRHFWIRLSNGSTGPWSQHMSFDVADEECGGPL